MQLVQVPWPHTEALHARGRSASPAYTGGAPHGYVTAQRWVAVDSVELEQSIVFIANDITM